MDIVEVPRVVLRLPIPHTLARVITVWKLVLTFSIILCFDYKGIYLEIACIVIIFFLLLTLDKLYYTALGFPDYPC